MNGAAPMNGPAPTSAAAPMTRSIEEVMGIPVIVEAGGQDFDSRSIGRVFEWLRFVDRTFSTYKADSQISMINRGEMALEQAHPCVRSVLRRCEQLRETTGGFFDVAHGPRTHEVDPSGFVKGWALQRARRILDRAGAQRYSLNAGGDICLAGAPPGQDAWRVGVQHPRQRQAIAAVLALRDGAVATSGAYERGAHIIDPRTGRPPTGVLSVTILGRDLALADAYATAAFAMGAEGARWAARLPGHGAIVILDDDTISYSAGVERFLALGQTPKEAA